MFWNTTEQSTTLTLTRQIKKSYPNREFDASFLTPFQKHLRGKKTMVLHDSCVESNIRVTSASSYLFLISQKHGIKEKGFVNLFFAQ